MNIQNSNENELFTLKLPKNFSFIDIAFNHSYRKVVIDNDYRSYNKFIIDLDSIEETMTELLLKNKKLLNDNIINFVYKNENLSFENTDIITIFNSNPSFQLKQVDLNDKVILYEFYEEHFEDINLLKQIINDFIQLIMFINNNKNNENISDKIGGTKEIFEVFGVLNDIKLSDEFKGIFNEKNNLTINKLTNLFIFYLRLIFDKVIKDEFKEFQDDNIEEKKEEKIKKYFNSQNKNKLIERNTFRNAIRLFITLYLNNEKEKEEKIKNNSNNVANYLNIKDIWIEINTNKKEFKDELKEIKELKIQINQILPIYDLLRDENEDDSKSYEDIEKEIKKRKEEDNASKKIEDEEEDKSKKSEDEDEDNSSKGSGDEEEPAEQIEEDDDDNRD